MLEELLGREPEKRSISDLSMLAGRRALRDPFPGGGGHPRVIWVVSLSLKGEPEAVRRAARKDRCRVAPSHMARIGFRFKSNYCWGPIICFCGLGVSANEHIYPAQSITVPTRRTMHASDRAGAGNMPAAT